MQTARRKTEFEIERVIGGFSNVHKFPWGIARMRQQCRPCRKRPGNEASWGERERAPTLLISMEIVYVRTYVRPRPTARLRMREIRINVYVIYVVFLTRDHNIS